MNNIDTQPAEGVAPILYVFANRTPAPELESLLAMIYSAAYDNTLGVMQALNSETNAEEVVLVGVAVDEAGKTACFPLASLLAVEDVPKYRAPTGQGSWYDPADEEATKAVQDSMKAIDDSLTDIALH